LHGDDPAAGFELELSVRGKNYRQDSRKPVVEDGLLMTINEAGFFTINALLLD
jgi:hypothetical protein